MVLDGLGIGLARVLEAALDAAHQAVLGLSVVGQAVGRGQHVGQRTLHVNQPLHVSAPKRVEVGIDQQRQAAGVLHADGDLWLLEAAQVDGRAAVAPVQPHRQVDLVLHAPCPGHQRHFHDCCHSGPLQWWCVTSSQAAVVPKKPRP